MSELPKGWVETTIGEICSFVRGVAYKKEQATDRPGKDTVAVLRANNLQSGTFERDDIVYVPGSVVSSDQLLQPGDTVLAMSSGSASVVGKAVSVQQAEPNTAFGAFCGLIRPHDTVVGGWLRHYFQTQSYREAMTAAAAGVNINNLRAGDLLSLKIWLPTDAEQRRIVARLDELLARSRRAKEELAAIPALLERYRQSVLAAAFRGDLTADWRAKNPDVESATRWLQRRGIDVRTDSKGCADHGLPTGWSAVPIRDIAAKVTSGSRAWSKYYDQGKAVFVLAQNVRNTGLEFRSTQYVNPPVDDPERERTRIEIGDVLVTIVGANTGDCCDVRQQVHDHYVCQSVALVRPMALELSRWVSMFVQTSVVEGGALSGDIYGAARPHLGLDHLRNLVVPIPPHLEMTRALCVFDQWEVASKSIREGCEQHLNQIDALERAILTRAFRGELVPQDPADEPASVLLERIRAERAAAPVKKKSGRQPRRDA
ncbi:MAG: restriction endonuclease subunit S [Polyangiales bacterium]